MRPFALDRLIEQLLEDESLTHGLPESEAQELVSWLIGLLEESEGQEAREIQALGRRIARIAASFGVPVLDLIELVEAAWGEAQVEAAEDEPLFA